MFQFQTYDSPAPGYNPSVSGNRPPVATNSTPVPTTGGTSSNGTSPVALPTAWNTGSVPLLSSSGPFSTTELAKARNISLMSGFLGNGIMQNDNGPRQYAPPMANYSADPFATGLGTSGGIGGFTAAPAQGQNALSLFGQPSQSTALPSPYTNLQQPPATQADAQARAMAAAQQPTPSQPPQVNGYPMFKEDWGMGAPAQPVQPSGPQTPNPYADNLRSIFSAFQAQQSPLSKGIGSIAGTGV